MLARSLVEIVVFIHYTVMLYLLVGGFLVWRWRWAIVPHLLMASWAIAIITLPVTCPLTALENHFRQQAGLGSMNRGFIDTYIDGVWYPSQYVGLVRWLVAAVVVTSWLVAWWRWGGDGRAGTDRVDCRRGDRGRPMAG